MHVSFLLFIVSCWIFCVFGAPIPTKVLSSDIAHSTDVLEFNPLLHVVLHDSKKVLDRENFISLSRRFSKRQKKQRNISRYNKHIHKNASGNHQSGSKRKQGSPSNVEKGACKRRIHHRDIFRRASSSSGSSDCSDEFAKKDIPITLKTTSTQEQVTETIKKGSKNLGHGGGAANNAGVYRLEKWGDNPGPYIAKKFHTEREMTTEARNLNKAGHLIASGDSHSPWAVMHFVPGAPLAETKEYADALKSSKEDCEKFMRNRHAELADAVKTLHSNTQMLHSDLKEENVHWTFDSNGEGKAHLLDFGQMRHKPKAEDNIYKLVTTGNEKTPEGYGRSRAEKLYPLSKCPDH